MKYIRPTIIIYRHDTLGGTGTLSYRLGKWLVQNNYEVIYLCERFNDKNNVDDMIDVGIKVRRLQYKDIVIKLNNEFGNRSYIVLSYSMYEFLRIELLKKKLNIVRNIVYIVGYRELMKGLYSNFIIKNVIRFFYKKIIEKILQNNQLIFMEEHSIKLAIEYYNLKGVNVKDIIFPLPIETKPYKKDIILKKIENEKFEILTITRAEFPYKGYILGLIDEFDQLSNEYNNVYLTIIAHGNDVNKILAKIRSLSKEKIDKIKLVGLTPYNELENYFHEASLYVGMGTTILDSVNHSTPAIIVKPHTYACVTSGFFNRQPYSLGACEDKLVSFHNIVSKVIQMNEYEYMKLCMLENSILSEKYDINKLSEFLTAQNISKEKRLNSFFLYFNLYFYLLRRLCGKFKI